MSSEDVPKPALRIVRGEPTPEDLAALTALLSAAGSDEPEPEAPQRGRFADPARMVRRPVQPGPGGWRGSAL